MSEASAVVREFVERINAHDPRRLSELMTENHRFVDAMGGEFSGRRTMRQGWESFLGMFPDYRVEVSELIAQGEVVAIFGFASGRFSGNAPGAAGPSFRFPAAWRAVVRDGLVAEWSVYCDVEPMLRAAGGGRFPA